VDNNPSHPGLFGGAAKAGEEKEKDSWKGKKKNCIPWGNDLMIGGPDSSNGQAQVMQREHRKGLTKIEKEEKGKIVEKGGRGGGGLKGVRKV